MIPTLIPNNSLSLQPQQASHGVMNRIPGGSNSNNSSSSSSNNQAFPVGSSFQSYQNNSLLAKETLDSDETTEEEDSDDEDGSSSSDECMVISENVPPMPSFASSSTSRIPLSTIQSANMSNSSSKRLSDQPQRAVPKFKAGTETISLSNQSQQQQQQQQHQYVGPPSSKRLRMRKSWSK